MTRQDIQRRQFVRGAGAVLLAASAGRAWASDSPFSVAERRAIGEALGLRADAPGLSDADLAARVLHFARRETGQRLTPSRLNRLWALDPEARDVAAEFAAARARGDLSGWLDGLAPGAPAYRALLDARSRYATLADAGGWQQIAAGPTLRVGDGGPAVAQLRARLAVEGYAEPAAAGDAFDAGLAAAVREFQSRRALDVDGVVGPATRRALDVSAAERLAQIDANLERWRWTRSPPADRVVVDTGTQEAVLFRGGAVVLSMRAIVGTPDNPTPMFRSAVSAVVFNPPWNVPASIAANELLPAEARRPGTLASMGIRWVDGHLQQRPGPTNSLGVVKFDLDSPFGVYMHDTPGKGLFARPVRTFSHGCMRLEKPRELAAALLGWSAAAVDGAIAARATRRIALGRTVPLFVVHRTVRVGADGRAEFRPDVYGWDRDLAAALPRSGA